MQTDPPNEGEPVRREPPAWFVVGTVAGGLVTLICAAALAGIVVSTPVERDGGTAVPSSNRQATRRAPTTDERAPAPPGETQVCASCNCPGTVCQDGLCLLRPGVAWKVSPMALWARDIGASNIDVCLGGGKYCWTSYGGRPQPPWRMQFAFPNAGPKMVVTTEEMAKGITVAVQVGFLRTPLRLLKTPPPLSACAKLFADGYLYHASDRIDFIVRLEPATGG